jgi:hypothetical protein
VLLDVVFLVSVMVFLVSVMVLLVSVVVFLVSVVVLLVSVMSSVVSLDVVFSSELVDFERLLLDDLDDLDVDGVAMFLDFDGAGLVFSFTDSLDDLGDGLLADLSMSLELSHDDVAVLDNLLTAISSFLSFTDDLDDLLNSLSCDLLNTLDSLSWDSNCSLLDDLDDLSSDGVAVFLDNSGAGFNVLSLSADVVDNLGDGLLGWSCSSLGDLGDDGVAVFSDGSTAVISLTIANLSDDVLDGLGLNNTDGVVNLLSEDDGNLLLLLDVVLGRFGELAGLECSLVASLGFSLAKVLCELLARNISFCANSCLGGNDECCNKCKQCNQQNKFHI